MKRSKFSEAQIAFVLKHAEAAPEMATMRAEAHLGVAGASAM